MSQLPGFHKIGGATKFSELEMDKTFDESMKLLNQHSTEYEWFFTKLHNDWDFSLNGTNIHSEFDFDTTPAQEEIIEDFPTTYAYIKMNHQYSYYDIPLKLHTSFGNLISAQNPSDLYLPGTMHYSDLRGLGSIDRFDINTFSSFFGISNQTYMDDNMEHVMFSTTSQSINGYDILTTKSNQRRIQLDTTYHDIHNSTEIASYSTLSENTLVLTGVSPHISEYTLGKDTVFEVPLANDNVRQYTLIGINGRVLIRDIPRTVTQIGVYSPAQENFILDLSYLTISEIVPEAFQNNCKGVVLVNENTFDLLQGENRIDGDGPDYTLSDNPDVIIRVVA